MTGVVNYNDELVDNTKIIYYLPKTLKEIISIYDIPLPEGGYIIYVNERISDDLTEIEDGDDIVIEGFSQDYLNKPDDESQLLLTTGETVAEESTQEECSEEQPDTKESSKIEFGEREFNENEFNENEFNENEFSENEFNEEGFTKKESMEEEPGQMEPTGLLDEITSGNGTVLNVNGNMITLDRSDIILADILIRVDMPMKPPTPGMRLEMTVNGVAAEFTTPLKKDDEIILTWVK